MRSGLSVSAWVVLILVAYVFRRLVVTVIAVILALLILAWAIPGFPAIGGHGALP